MTGIFFGLHEYSFLAATGIGLCAAFLGGLQFTLPALRVQYFHLGFVTMSGAIVFPQLLMALDKWANGINGISVRVPGLEADLAFGLTPLTLMVAL